jgi:ribosomal protein L28
MSKQVFAIASNKTLREDMLNVWNMVNALVNDEKKGVKVTVQTAAIRSLDQNRRLWAMLNDISQQVEWYGRMLEPDDWKHVFSAALKGTDAVPGINGGFVVLGNRTSEMSIKEMGELIMLMEAFGAEKGVRFRAPEWREE